MTKLPQELIDAIEKVEDLAEVYGWSTATTINNGEILGIAIGDKAWIDFLVGDDFIEGGH